MAINQSGNNNIPNSKKNLYSVILGISVIVLIFVVYTIFSNSRNGSGISDKPEQSSSIDKNQTADEKSGGEKSSAASNQAGNDSAAEKPASSLTSAQAAEQSAANSAKGAGSDKQNDPAAKKPPFKILNKKEITKKEDFLSSSWSPEGLDVLCTRAKYKGIYLVSANGSDIRTITDDDSAGYKVKWSKDGTKLMTEVEGKKKVYDLTGEEVTDYDANDFPAENAFSRDDNIYVKDPATGEEKPITNGGDAYFAPVESPDGSKVVYQGLESGLHIKDVTTGEVLDIGQGGSAQWSLDGKGVIYSFTQDDGMTIISGDIYFAFADGSGVFNITDSPDIIEMNPHVSPDGKQITYEVNGQIFVADLEEVLN